MVESKYIDADKQQSAGARETSNEYGKDFEELLAYIGSYGTYQKRVMYFFMIPLLLFIPMSRLAFFIQMQIPDHWCSVPGRNLTDFTVDEWKSLTIPIE
jgi:hypothetical protein